MIKNSDDIRQLVIVCRDYDINWNQFINPIFVGVETGILVLLKHKKPINFICGDNDTITKQQLKLFNEESKKNKAFLPLCTIRILSHKWREKPKIIYMKFYFLL